MSEKNLIEEKTLVEERPEVKTCLVLTPMTPEFAPVRRVIKEVLEELGIVPVLFEEVQPVISESVQHAIFWNLTTADLIIADLTGNDPNIMYEIGFAHGWRKKVVLIAQKGTDIPFELRGFIYIPYALDEIEKFRALLRRWLEKFYL